MQSVSVRLFFINFLCILVLVVAMGVFSFTKSKAIIQTKVSEATEQTILLAGDKIEQTLKIYDDLTLQMQNDRDFMDKLRNAYAPGLGDIERRQAVGAVNTKLTAFFSGKTEVLKVGIVHIASGKMIGTNGTNIPAETIQQADWFKKVSASEGAAIWLETEPKGYLASEEPTFALTRSVRDPLSGTRDYAFFVELKVKVLNEALDKLSLAGEFPVVILDKESKLVRTSNAELIGTPFEVVLTEAQMSESSKLAQSASRDDNLVVYKQLANGWTVAAAAPVSKLVKETGQLLDMIWIMSGFAMVLTIGAGLFTARVIGRPLSKLQLLMAEGEKGNLTVRMESSRKDEIGRLVISFNRMMEQITKLVTQTNHSASEVLNTSGVLLNVSKQTATSAREIAVATEEIAGGASSLAVEAEKGNTITNDIGRQMKEVIEANREMERAAGEVEQVSERGTVYMSELIGKTSMTEQMTRSMVEKVDRLKDSTSSIRKILDVLNNMTKQTNILSLNATIEAARAGAAGKGFMVVADEIRKLAEQSKQSIEVVGQITDKIQLEIDETVKVLSDAYPVFREQIASVKEAELIFKQVRGQMGSLSERLGGVTGSVERLELSQRSLTEAMTNVSAVSEESSATSQEVASLSNEQLSVSQGLVKLSEDLEALSASLQEQLSRFKV